MKLNQWKIAACVYVLCAVSCAKADDPVPTPPPVVPPPVVVVQVASVSSFVPQTATAGDPIMITGKNLTGSTVVMIGNTAAQSFQVVSDTLIMAYVATGASSGKVTVSAPLGNAEATGFTYYTPQQSTLTGTMTYATLSNNQTPKPNYDSTNYKSFLVPETISFAIRKINPNDEERNRTAMFAQLKTMRSRYADSANFVIINGVISQDPTSQNGYGGELNSFSSLPSLKTSVFARVVGETITIPSQTPINGYISIQGSGVIKNGVVLSLDYVIDDSHGNSKRGSMVKP